MTTTPLDPAKRRRARRNAEQLEREAERYPEERAEILLEAAGQWALAGELEPALRVCDAVIAAGPGEDADYAAAQRIITLADLGRGELADAEIERLARTLTHSGPAYLVGELLEEQGRLDEALTWFNVACRELIADPEQGVEELTAFPNPEADGRRRVREALGLPPDELDLATADARDKLTELLDGAVPAEPPPPAATFFLRSDVPRAFAEGLVQTDDHDDHDVPSYFRKVERGWRASCAETGAARMRVLPTTVDDLLGYAAEHGRDPKDQETRADHLRERLASGAAAVDWPPARNASCWCASGRKYKKCCGAPSNR